MNSEGSFWCSTLEAVDSNIPFNNNYVTGFAEFGENIWIELNFEEALSVCCQRRTWGRTRNRISKLEGWS